MMDRKNKTRCLWHLYFLYLVILAYVLLKSLHMSVDVNDDHILHGLELEIITLMITYGVLLYFASMKSVRMIAALTFIMTLTLTAIPLLKYKFILNPWDSMLHYGSIRETIKNAHTTEVGPYVTQYAHIHALHILPAMLSILCKLDPANSMKIMMLCGSSLIPLLIFSVVIKLKITKSVQAGIIALAPLTSSFYVFTGVSATYPLYSFILCLLLTLYTNISGDARIIFLLIIVKI